MNLDEAIEIVEGHNAWRRDISSTRLPARAKVLCKAVDVVLAAAKFANNIDTYTVKDEATKAIVVDKGGEV